MCLSRCVGQRAVRPHSTAAASAARIRAAATPRRRARRWTSIFATSARCGRFSGRARTGRTVPHTPAASSATRSTRPPVSTAAATGRQNATARSRQRVHEADRRSALDAIDQHVSQLVDQPGVERVQAPDGPGEYAHRREWGRTAWSQHGGLPAASVCGTWRDRTAAAASSRRPHPRGLVVASGQPRTVSFRSGHRDRAAVCESGRPTHSTAG